MAGFIMSVFMSVLSMRDTYCDLREYVELCEGIRMINFEIQCKQEGLWNATCQYVDDEYSKNLEYNSKRNQGN